MLIQNEVFLGGGGGAVSHDPFPVNTPSIFARPSLFTLV